MKNCAYILVLLLAAADKAAAQLPFEAALSQDLSGFGAAIPEAVPEILLPEREPGGGAAGPFVFRAGEFPGFYDASRENREPYNIPEILRDIPGMWKEYGQLFRKVGSDLGMDPFALAAYCVFESYHEGRHTFNIRHLDGGAAGIASTQAGDVRGGLVPGLKTRIPRDLAAAKQALRANPEYGVRYLAAEFRAWYLGGDYFRGYYGDQMYNRLFGAVGFAGYRDLARTFPRVAYPGWSKPGAPKGNYGTQAQYVSRAHALYTAFRSADGR